MKQKREIIRVKERRDFHYKRKRFLDLRRRPGAIVGMPYGTGQEESQKEKE